MKSGTVLALAFVLAACGGGSDPMTPGSAMPGVSPTPPTPPTPPAPPITGTPGTDPNSGAGIPSPGTSTTEPARPDVIPTSLDWGPWARAQAPRGEAGLPYQFDYHSDVSEFGLFANPGGRVSSNDLKVDEIPASGEASYAGTVLGVVRNDASVYNRHIVRGDLDMSVTWSRTRADITGTSATVTVGPLSVFRAPNAPAVGTIDGYRFTDVGLGREAANHNPRLDDIVWFAKYEPVEGGARFEGDVLYGNFFSGASVFGDTQTLHGAVVLARPGVVGVHGVRMVP